MKTESRNDLPAEAEDELLYTHISASHSAFDLKLNEVWRYRDLIFLFSKRNFQVKYKQTVLGPLWLIIKPMLTAVFQVILFGNIAKLSTDGVPQFLFYLSGNAIWSFFSTCVTRNAETFTSNALLFGKVYFPRLVIPISCVLSGIINFFIQLLLIAAIYLFFFAKGMVSPTPELLLTIPLILLTVGLLGMGVGIIISSLTTKYRDLSVLVEFGIQLWMYATPVVYPMSTVSGKLKTFIMLNPVTAPIELFRRALFSSGGVSAGSLVMTALVTAAVVLLGIMIFNKVERNFMDTV